MTLEAFLNSATQIVKLQITAFLSLKGKLSSLAGKFSSHRKESFPELKNVAGKTVL